MTVIAFKHNVRAISRMVFLLTTILGICPLAVANFTCSGQITYLGVNSASSLYVSVGSFGIWPICNLAGTASNGGSSVPIDTCKAWYSALLTQKSQGSPITLYFTSNDTGNNGPDCVALVSWQVLSPLPYHMDYQ